MSQTESSSYRPVYFAFPTQVLVALWFFAHSDSLPTAVEFCPIKLPGPFSRLRISCWCDRSLLPLFYIYTSHSLFWSRYGGAR